jgi:hypothetical protein
VSLVSPIAQRAAPSDGTAVPGREGDQLVALPHDDEDAAEQNERRAGRSRGANPGVRPPEASSPGSRELHAGAVAGRESRLAAIGWEFSLKRPPSGLFFQDSRPSLLDAEVL